jgi:hypothetical protein
MFTLDEEPEELTPVGASSEMMMEIERFVQALIERMVFVPTVPDDKG